MIQERIFIIIIACLLDLVFGDPHWLWHPVQGMGWLIDHVETWMRKRFRIREDRDADIRKKQVAGTFTVVIVITVSLLVAAGILYGCNRISTDGGCNTNRIACVRICICRRRNRGYDQKEKSF